MLTPHLEGAAVQVQQPQSSKSKGSRAFVVAF